MISSAGDHPDSTDGYNSGGPGDDPAAVARSHKMRSTVLKTPLKDRIQILRRRQADRIRDKDAAPLGLCRLQKGLEGGGLHGARGLGGDISWTGDTVSVDPRCLH